MNTDTTYSSICIFIDITLMANDKQHKKRKALTEASAYASHKITSKFYQEVCKWRQDFSIIFCKCI